MCKIVRGDTIQSIAIIAMAVMAFVLTVSPAWAQQQSVPVSAPASAYSEPPYDELVLEVRRNDDLLARTILGFQGGMTDYYIPLGDLARLVGFDVELNLNRGFIRGWYLSTDNTYEVDAKNLTYTVRGQTVPLTKNDIFMRDYGAGFGDIYVRLETLNEILPLDLHLDFAALKLDVQTSEKLPYEMKKEREAKREKFLSMQQGEESFAGYRNIENPYRMFSEPIIDLDGSFVWDSEEESWNNNIHASGKNDLLGFSADYGVNIHADDGDWQAPDKVRMTLTKQAFGNDTMPLGVRNLSLGDVSARTPEWVRGSNAGRGVSVSTRPVKRQQTFDEITVEGTAAPGWEVELYRNNELLDFGVVGERGDYRFDNVELLAGQNNIRTVLYGPQGQIEERTEEYKIGSSLARPGETFYEASIVDTSNSTIAFDDNNGRQNQDKGIAYSGAVTHGLSRNATVFGTVSNSMTRKGEKKYVTAGVNASVGRVIGKAEVYKQLDGGQALDTRLATSMKGWNLNLRTAMFKDFESDRAGYEESARTLDTRVRATKRFPTAAGMVGLSFSGSHEIRKNNTEATQLQAAQNLARRTWRTGNSLQMNWRDRQLETVQGRLDGSVRLGRQWNLRTALNYDVRPDFAFDDFMADLLYRHSRKLTTGVNLGRDLQDGQMWGGGHIDYDFGSFMSGLQMNWREDSGYNLALRASTSLGPFGKNGGYTASSRSMQGQNAVRGRVFWDKDLDGVYTGEDEPLEDARMMLAGKRTERADESGFLSQVSSENGDYVGMTFDRNSVDNPFLVSSEDGYRLLLRPGVAQHIDVPVVEGGTVDGTVFFEDGNPVPGLRMQMVNKEGVVVGQSVTSFDGFYTFELIRPGAYVIQADPALDLNMAPQLVTVTPEELFRYGIDMEVQDKEEIKNAKRFAALPEELQKNKYASILGTLKQMQQTLSQVAN
ncbi:MAG: carboxypeptidase regulatory-like domain-containing protein [Rhodospirillales bacterium]|nr:carboxypeptidase regulatory-like domain-containing protein [Rhodospirillales bacterium]